jgi:hypothetical protein
MFNDRLDDLFTGEQTTAPRTAAARAPEGYRPAEQMFTEGCRKCRGTGQTRWGVCFRCNGKGGKTFKTSPETRAQNREHASERRTEQQVAAFDAFERDFPAEAKWLVATAPRWEVAAQWLRDLIRFGDLTEGKLAAIRKCMARDAERAAAKAAPGTEIDTGGIDRLKAAFDKAIAYTAEKGLKLSPRITIGAMVIAPAKAASANPGALYVKATDRTYLGKIADGRFFASRECTEQQRADVLKFVADPAEASKVYGQTTGTCCVCNATLKSEWKLRGIGPICAQKFGW